MLGFRSAKQTGDIGEKAAARMLRRAGFRICDRNYRTPHGEIDIIACNREYIIFVEVKTRQVRSDSKFGRPADAVDRRKRGHLRYSAACYLREHPTDKKPRMDIVEVYKEEAKGKMHIVDIRHYSGAFGSR